jgi:hypothetical protein
MAGRAEAGPERWQRGPRCERHPWLIKAHFLAYASGSSMCSRGASKRGHTSPHYRRHAILTS